MKTFSYILLFFAGINSTSCTRLVYGIKSPKAISQTEIKAKAQKFNMDTTALYELNQQFLYQMYQWQQSGLTVVAKHRHQPLQALYFNQEGKMVSQQLNCFAQGFPNLRWRREGRMKVFPPASATLPDKDFNLPLQMRVISPIHPVKAAQIDSSAYTIAIYWNCFMGRQTRRLARIIHQNILKAGNSKYQLLYINTDNYFAGRLP